MLHSTKITAVAYQVAVRVNWTILCRAVVLGKLKNIFAATEGAGYI
jgi:hypothetical protein